MASFNKVILLGNLTRDPELRFTPSGTAIAKIGLAVNRTWRSQTGETKEEVTFIDIDAFGRQAEVIGQYLKKGRPLFLEGRLKLDSWEDKQTGQKQSRLRVVLESFQFVDSGRGRDEGDAPRSSAPPQSQRPSPPPDDLPAPEEDDVPF